MLNMRVTLELLQEILKQFYPKLMIESFRVSVFIYKF